MYSGGSLKKELYSPIFVNKASCILKYISLFHLPAFFVRIDEINSRILWEVLKHDFFEKKVSCTIVLERSENESLS